MPKQINSGRSIWLLLWGWGLFFAFQTAPLSAADNEAGRIKLLEKAPYRPLSAADVLAISESPSPSTADGYTSVVSVVDCFDDMLYHYTGGRYTDEPIRFRLRTPYSFEPGQTYPLVVWFHGRGESGHDNQRQLAHKQAAIDVLAGPGAKEFFVLVVQCPEDNKEWAAHIDKEDGKGDAMIVILREIMDAVIDEFPVDEDRVSVYGLSNGGEAACMFVAQSPERFAALAIASAVPPKGMLPNNMNIWVFCCDKDEGVPLDQVRESVDTAHRENGSVFLTVLNASDHNSWTYSLKDKNILGWLVLQKRDSPFLSPPPGWNGNQRSILATILLFGFPTLCFIALNFVVVRSRRCRCQKNHEKTG